MGPGAPTQRARACNSGRLVGHLIRAAPSLPPLALQPTAHTVMEDRMAQPFSTAEVKTLMLQLLR